MKAEKKRPLDEGVQCRRCGVEAAVGIGIQGGICTECRRVNKITGIIVTRVKGVYRARPAKEVLDDDNVSLDKPATPKQVFDEGREMNKFSGGGKLLLLPKAGDIVRILPPKPAAKAKPIETPSLPDKRAPRAQDGEEV